ncbi:MAG TPA: F0F1 ATP synthase subunit delta [Novimethylophilus sp.]|jgi:F-type H+-transporting ATPase subunit delta|uniref:F0F1 ATP synthase subunit delta n=1 Tax=Novimethylophilus sp. TaxID=2137426 RepID=UPI002F420B9F
MAEAVTIARPYAVAVFRLAKEKNALVRWSEMLAFITAVANDVQMQALNDDPRVPAEQVERVFLAVGGDKLDAQAANLIKLLVEYRRLGLLPEIARLFEEFKAADEGVVEAEITAAAQPDAAQVKALVSQLEARFKQKVVAHVNVDPEIIGGVKIVVGDTVIDASVRGRLQEMAYTLKG